MNLENIKVNVSVKLCETEMTLEEISNLKNDDIIDFTKKVNSSVELFIGDIKLGEGEVMCNDDGNFSILIKKLENNE